VVQNHVDFVVCCVTRVFNRIKYSFGIASPCIALIARIATRWGQILVFGSTAATSDGIFFATSESEEGEYACDEQENSRSRKAARLRSERSKFEKTVHN
jgi:hypothetical protein